MSILLLSYAELAHLSALIRVVLFVRDDVDIRGLEGGFRFV